MVVDQKKCLGCGTCTVLAPKTFVLTSKGKAIVKITGKGDSPKAVKEAMESCAVQAISYKK